MVPYSLQFPGVFEVLLGLQDAGECCDEKWGAEIRRVYLFVFEMLMQIWKMNRN